MPDTEEESFNAPATPMSLKHGILITLLVIVGVAAWIYLGTAFLAIKSFFASFLLLWYWATVEKAAFDRLPASVIGALTGVGLALSLKILPAALPSIGLWLALGIIVVAIFIQVMNWLPLALNACAMLFLTVLAAPSLLMQIDMVEIGKAVVLGAIFFMGVVQVAHVYARLEKRFSRP
jgi:hypothetical protein